MRFAHFQKCLVLPVYTERKDRRCGVIKQRVARAGQGKSGGYRTIILFRKGERAFFVYGYAKSERENIEQGELSGFKKLASGYLGLSEKQIETPIKDKRLEEVK